MISRKRFIPGPSLPWEHRIKMRHIRQQRPCVIGLVREMFKTAVPFKAYSCRGRLYIVQCMARLCAGPAVFWHKKRPRKTTTEPAQRTSIWLWMKINYFSTTHISEIATFENKMQDHSVTSFEQMLLKKPFNSSPEFGYCA